ncbi:hypothetical protein, partial [Herbaspirillum frisingense]|uniref:hypothetical protein n=1 Tax=Herbaspirillum frisingense TaxID=92645 RepID=UPI0039AFA85C
MNAGFPAGRIGQESLASQIDQAIEPSPARVHNTAASPATLPTQRPFSSAPPVWLRTAAPARANGRCGQPR